MAASEKRAHLSRCGVAFAMIALLFLIFLGGAGWGRAVASDVPRYAGPQDIDPKKSHFILVGDTQQTSRWEFWRERNQTERQKIVQEIGLRAPAFVVHLGDLTARGSSEKHWSEFDGNHRAIREKRIPYFPVLGNHELYGDDKAALAHFFGRFPHLGQRRWYSFTWRDVAFILLDSNLEEMSPEETKRQTAWYQAELARFEGDEAVGCIIVACHKPPFTNSKVVGSSAKVRAGFVPPFLAAKKTRLFLSGHSHSYERFSAEGKTFIVAGGGGGPRHRLYRDPMTRPFNDLFDGPELRFFHFCEVEWREHGLAFRVIRLDQDGTFQEVDPLFLPKKTAGNRSQDLYLSPAHFAR